VNIPNDSVVADFTPQPVWGCDSMTVQLTNNSIGATGYQWDFGNGDTSTAASPTGIYQTPGSYTITLIASDTNQCTPNDTTQQTISYAAAPPAPVAYFNPSPTPHCDSLTVDFLNYSIGATGFYWDFGNGMTSTDSMPSVTYYVSDTFQVLFVALDTGICNRHDTAFATIISNIPDDSVSAAFTGNTFPGCDSLRVDLSNHSYGGDGYWWDFGNGVTTNDTSPSVLYTNPGTYAIRLIVVDTGFCANPDTAMATLNVPASPPAPVAGFTPQIQPTCDSLAVLFTNSSTNAGGYYWDFGNGDTSTQSAPQIAYFTTDTFTVMLVALDTSICHRHDTAFATIISNIPDDSVSAAFTDTTMLGCDSLRVDLTNQSYGGIGYWWDFGNGVTTTDTSPSVVYTNPGSYTIQLIVLDTGFCATPDTAVTTVNLPAPPPAPLANFTPQIQLTCDSLAVLFSNSSTNGAGYYWDFGNGDTSMQSAPQIAYFTSDTFVVMLVALDTSICQRHDTAFVTIIANLPDDSVNAAFTTVSSLGCDSLRVDLTNQSYGGDRYWWSFGNGASSSDTSPSYIYTDTGLYTITLVVTDTGLCRLSDTATATVAFPGLTHPTADISYSMQDGCDTLFVQFANNSSGAFGYLWDFGNGLTSGTPSPSVTYTTSDTFQVQMVALDTGRCAEHDTAFVTFPFQPINDTTVAAFTYQQQSGCDSLQVDFFNHSYGAIAYYPFGHLFRCGNLPGDAHCARYGTVPLQRHGSGYHPFCPGAESRPPHF